MNRGRGSELVDRVCDHVAGDVTPLRPSVAVWRPRPKPYKTGPRVSEGSSSRPSSVWRVQYYGVCNVQSV
jgi:hypothetical protein